MAQDTSSDFKLFDPFEAIDFENPQDESDYVEFVPPIGKPDADAEATEKPLPPASERIAAMFAGMSGEGKLLLHVMDFCREAREPQAIVEEIKDFRRSAVSVYKPETVCVILEQAGAIEMLYDGDLDAEPETFMEDGVEYLKIEESPAFTYKTTPEGIEVLEANVPVRKIEQMLDEDERALSPLFCRILEACGGAGLLKKEIDGLVDADPLVQNPRRFSGFFIDKLEQAGALDFDAGKWVTTPAGADLLAGEMLSTNEEV